VAAWDLVDGDKMKVEDGDDNDEEEVEEVEDGGAWCGGARGELGVSS
jgi:hypothetical protein